MIYLDHHAAAPLCLEAQAAMEAARAEGWANPSSTHAAGRRARSMLEDARRAIAEAIGAAPAEITLTSGGTEAINLGVRGLARLNDPPSGPPHEALSSALEHPAVSGALGETGLPVRLIEVAQGPDVFARSLAHETTPGALVTLQWVNHETGIRLDVETQVSALRTLGARVFVDATQALGKLPVDVSTLGADAVAFAAHKMGGPAGAGALWVRRGLTLPPLLSGGGQERGLRAGSPDVVAAVGFGAAARALQSRLAAMPPIARRRDRLEAHLVALGGRVAGADWPRVSTVTQLSFDGWKGPVLAAALDVEGLCVSSGSACSSGLAEPSRALLALYPHEPQRAASALRLSLGPETSDEDVEATEFIVEKVIRRQRGA